MLISTPGLHSGDASRVDFKSTPQQFLAQFRVCLRGASKVSSTSDRRQKAPLKWPTVQPMRNVLLIANGNPLYGGCQFEKPFQPIRVVLLIANGGPLWRLPFLRQKSREANKITSRRHLERSPGGVWHVPEVLCSPTGSVWDQHFTDPRLGFNGGVIRLFVPQSVGWATQHSFVLWNLSYGFSD